MSVIIGIDPHKASHAACAIDDSEQELAISRCVPDTANSSSWSPGRNRSGRERGRSSRPAVSAISSPSNSSRRANVWSTCRRRCRHGCGCRNRTVEQERPERRAGDCHRGAPCTIPRGGASRRPQQRAAAVGQGAPRCRSGAVPGLLPVTCVRGRTGCRRDPQRNRCFAGPNAARGDRTGERAQRQRLELSFEFLEEIRALDARLKTSKQRITTAVVASGTTLTDLYGVGPIIAAIVIGYSGDVHRFPTAGHYAAYNGTAPIELSSGGRTVHRLSRRGNRTLNMRST